MSARLPRLLVVPLLATLVASPAEAGSHQIALGFSELPNKSESAYNVYSGAGYNPAIWSVWTTWADGVESGFPMGYLNKLAPGTVPMIIWEPAGFGKPPGGGRHGPGSDTDVSLQSSCGVAYDKIIKGDWDQYITSFATKAKKYSKTHGGNPLLMRFAHEADGSWFWWGYSRCTNTAAKFVKMWKHVVTIFREVGANKVRWVWSPLSASTSATPGVFTSTWSRKILYPGNSWVDYIGVTAFNWASAKNRPWQPLVTVAKAFTKGLSSYAPGKPIIIAETGSTDGSAEGASRPNWITKGYNAVYNKLPLVRAIVYFNIDMRGLGKHEPNWKLNTQADGQAYFNLLNDARFQGHIP